MREKIVAGNWKMNTSLEEGVGLGKKLNSLLIDSESVKNPKVILCAPFTHLESLVKSINAEIVFIGSQNCSQFESGAYTGEISAKMIRSIGVDYVIVGHSERRQFFGDTDNIIALKLEQCYKNNLKPIFCCGESLKERQNHKHFDVVKSQIVNAFKQIDVADFKKTIVAYEPVWAIGTGQTASPEQAQEMHSFIRSIIAEIYDETISENTSILYGGSVGAASASELFKCKDIDGGLVGGASLKAEDFVKIIKS